MRGTLTGVVPMLEGSLGHEIALLLLLQGRCLLRVYAPVPSVTQEGPLRIFKSIVRWRNTTEDYCTFNYT